jgi:polysaccharide biosynthesis PFTS motif protein
MITNSKYPISRELSRYLNRILFRNSQITKLESEFPIYDEYLRQIPKQLNRFDVSFLRANLKLVVRIAVLLILLFIPKKLEKHKDISLIYGLSYEQIYFEGSTTRLTEFLLSKKLGLAKNDLCYLEDSRHSILGKRAEKIRICRNIPTSIFHDFLNFGDKLQVIYLISQRMLMYLATLIKYPVVHHTAQAYVLDEVIFDYLNMNRKIKLVDLVATPSIITHIPYIFERNLHFGKRLMIWYSANSVPINYRNKDLVRFHPNEKIYECMPLDLHYVWNQTHKDYLDSVIDPPITVEVRGSLMFYLPQEEIAVIKVYDIVIFDVTPYEPTFKDGFDKIPFSQNSIYNESTATEFLQDLLWAKHEIEERFGVNLVLALKPKRKYTPLHSRGYLAFLDHLSKNGLITILTPEIDLYKTIGESKMSISYPFTSPAIIAMELNIPTAYFLANKSIESNALIDGIEFITDRTKLLDFIVKHRIMERG